MKKITMFLVLVLVLSSFSSLIAGAEESTEKVTINVYNWGQYIGEGEDGTIDVNAEFTKRTGIEVNYSIFDSNETMYSKLKTGGANYDVIIPSEYMVEKLKNEGMLEKINFDNVPNYKYIGESFKNTSYDPNNEYSVPYTFGTVGIIYNTKYVKEAPTSWDALWDERYAGKILMFDNCRDAYGIAQFYLGYSINTEDKTEFDKCTEILIKQKPLLQDYVMDQIYDKLINEEAWIAPYYAGDFVQMYADNSDLAIAYPEEGFNYFIDAICIPKDAKNKAAAEAYINFLCDPEIAAANMEAIGYATVNEGAKELMDIDELSEEYVYLSPEELENTEMFRDLSADTIRNMNDLWNSVKASKGVTSDGEVKKDTNIWYYVAGGAAVLIGIVIFAVVKNGKKKNLYDEK